jgi:hypothetical protein
MRRVQAHSVREEVPRRAFFCPRCQGWHLAKSDLEGGGGSVRL